MRKRFNFANVVAVLALFIALGGTAIAAKVIINKPKQLGKGVVTNTKVKKKTLSLNKLKKKARQKLQGQEGPKGAKGAQGEQGPIGPSNAISLSDDSAAIPQNPSDAEQVVATLELPGDAYTFVASFEIDAGDFNGVPNCTVSTPIGIFLDHHAQINTVEVQVGVPQVFTLSGALTVVESNDTGDQLQLRCEPDTAQSLTFDNVRFTATEVGSLTALP